MYIFFEDFTNKMKDRNWPIIIDTGFNPLFINWNSMSYFENIWKKHLYNIYINIIFVCYIDTYIYIYTYMLLLIQFDRRKPNWLPLQIYDSISITF